METPFFFLLFLLFLLYLAVVGMGGWAVLSASRKQAWRSRWHAGAASLQQRFGSAGKHLGTTWPWAVLSALRRCRSWLVARKRTVTLSLFLLGTPLLLAIAFLGTSSLEGYDDTPTTSDPVVLALLRGEQLVPPAALPPEYFTTKEIMAQQQDLIHASREWTQLDAEFRQRLLTVYELMARRGYQVALLEGYRSPERQAALAKLGSHVTNAGAYQSYHQYGLAADSAFMHDGKISISEKDPWTMEAYRQYGELAESVGLVWGGRWRMMDFGHVELRRPHVLGQPPSR